VEQFEGKVAVVTGAASGMGRAFTERFVQEGMKVVLADVEAGALEQAVDELKEAGGEVIGVRTDVSRLEDVEALAARTIDAFGAVHVVCNNAGGESGATFADIPPRPGTGSSASTCSGRSTASRPSCRCCASTRRTATSSTPPPSQAWTPTS